MHALSSGPMTYRTGFTTDISELDVVYGGEKRLYKAVKEIIDKYDPPAVFVYQTCVTAMIGDDIEAVCKAASRKFNKPVIPVNSPGFAGIKNLGNKLGGEALLDYVIGTEEPDYTTPYDINIIGEYNLSGELWQVKPLLDAIGVRVLACISGDAKYKEVAYSHRARAAMMVCSKAMINIARKMEERYQIPFFEGSFYGIGDMSESLAPNRAAAGGARGSPGHPAARGAVDRERGGARLGAYRTVQAALEGQEGAVDHRRREVLVGGGCAAGGRHGDRRHQRQEIDQRG